MRMAHGGVPAKRIAHGVVGTLCALLFALCACTLPAASSPPPPSAACLDFLDQLRHTDDQADRWWLSLLAQEACK